MHKTIIIGLGQTGLSVARYLYRLGELYSVMDNRLAPPLLNTLKKEQPHVPIHLGGFQAEWLHKAKTLIISPGVSINDLNIKKNTQSETKIIGDIELFCKNNSIPIVAITGSNGKSTVVTLVGEIAKNAGLEVGVGGNIGKPVLEFLTEKKKELYILELSSFQLETTFSLNANAAVILNISPDHMDRYTSMSSYIQAKKRIYIGCEHAVYNANDINTVPSTCSMYSPISFTDKKPNENQYGILVKKKETWLAKGSKLLLKTNDLSLYGLHNWMNALSAIALCEQVGINMKIIIETLKKYKGLPHRCEMVIYIDDVMWINDSKGTNIGSTQAAIASFSSKIKKNIIWIGGGQGKNANFSILKESTDNYVKNIILIGADAEKIKKEMNTLVPLSFANDLVEVIKIAHQFTEKGDVVLFSPACASFDMFENFEHRGDLFRQLVLDFFNE